MAGATIILLTIYFISLLFLTNFQLGAWVRWAWTWTRAEKAATESSPEEHPLERRARELQKQARQLQEEVERTGLGADLQPVPEPTVRDLSVPQAKPARAKKPAEPSKEPAPSDPVERDEMVPPREVAGATTADVLGKKNEPGSPEKAADDKTAEAKPEPVVHLADGSVPATKTEARTQETQTYRRRRHAHHRQLSVAAHGFPAAAGYDAEADGVERGIDGQRPTDAADPRAI